jgi:hypothetical protein
MENKIKEILANTLPSNTFIFVERTKAFFGGEGIKIGFAASDTNINDVRGQLPQLVSLYLDLANLKLHVQGYGGSGGNRIYRKVDPNNHKEKYYAMVGIKIPFRKPKAEEKFVLKALEKFAQKWVEAIKENKEVLMYQDLVNYNELLNS